MTNQEINENLILDSEIMDEKEQPVLYNPLFVMGYGVFLSVFAGSILMAMNFRSLNQKERAWKAVGLGLAYTVLQFIVMGLLQINNNMLTLPVSFLGMFLLDKFLWSTYVPDGLNYKNRNVIWPILIAIAITIPIIVIVVTSLNS